MYYHNVFFVYVQDAPVIMVRAQSPPKSPSASGGSGTVILPAILKTCNPDQPAEPTIMDRWFVHCVLCGCRRPCPLKAKNSRHHLPPGLIAVLTCCDDVARNFICTDYNECSPSQKYLPNAPMRIVPNFQCYHLVDIPRISSVPLKSVDIQAETFRYSEMS